MEGVYKLNTELVYHDIIECLVAALEAKDIYTSGHSSRVADMAVELAQKIGLQGKELEELHIAAHLHDIGKIGISEQVLNKPGKLLSHEWEQIKRHPVIGYQILSKSNKLKLIAKIVLYHHEQWNGKGYPENLQKEQIPLGSRIITVCDAIDAMTSDRSYRRALTFEETRAEIKANSGTQFDPTLVQALSDLWPKWENRFTN